MIIGENSSGAIPVCMYLRKNYPAVPPLCYVGEDGPSHTKLMTETFHTDCHGRVRNIPFIDEWKVGLFCCWFWMYNWHPDTSLAVLQSKAPFVNIKTRVYVRVQYRGHKDLVFFHSDELKVLKMLPL